MSLFPAYAKEKQNDQADSGNQHNDWLYNSSFNEISILQKPETDILSDSSDNEFVVKTLPSYLTKQKSAEGIISLDRHSDDSKTLKTDTCSLQCRKGKKKYKHYTDKNKASKHENEGENLYYEDSSLDRVNFTIDTFHSRARPLYNTSEKTLGFVCVKNPKKSIFQRYHVRNIDIEKNEKSCKKNIIFKKEKVKGRQEECLPQWSYNNEKEQMSKTQEFNEKLNENPENIDLWLKYIDFQNDLMKFQKYKSLKDSQRTTYLRQLSITDKALEKNPESMELLKVKLHLMSELLPADEFSNTVDSLLNKDSGNTILWQTLIMAIRSSVALCKVPKVLELYSRCLSILKHKLRSDPIAHDKQMLGILYECLIFLRHAGYWEQMWETIRMNLSLNFNIPQEKLKFQNSIDEKNLIDMEEVILSSRLPLNQLWLRVESLRERCHWITVHKDQLELIGDSKRYVLSEDVADFVHPLLSTNSNFMMGIYFLLSLKIPLLPTRDYTFKILQLDSLSWSYDSSEMLLPLAYPFVGELAGHCSRKLLITGLLDQQLTSGPQYLRFHPAQEPYLNFVRAAFQAIGETLPSYQRTSIYVWWLRFERLLILLGKDDPLKTDNRGKKLKVIVKDFLKKVENRNNVYFYKEYALIERELGRFDNCVNILETAIKSQSVFATSTVQEKAALFSLYRTLFETLLNCETYQESNVDRCLKIISCLVPESAAEDRLTNVERYLESCIKQFLNTDSVMDIEDNYFLSNFHCESIVCYAYFLYTTNHDIEEIITVFDKCLQHANKCPNLQEQLYESKVAILQLHFERSQERQEILINTLKEALKLYENNFYLLSVYVIIQSELPCWKFGTRNENISISYAMAMCLANRARMQKLRNLELFDAASGMLNKTLTFYKTLTGIPIIQCCPLIWRLYMLLLREENLQERKGEEVYHESVTLCPWARSIYIDAAEVAPQVLTQIQDVIQEKELRIHVTPEELNILRG